MSLSGQSEDASMMDGGQTIDDDWFFSKEAVDWILKNKAKLEEQVQKQKAGENKLWSLQQWETFEQWASNQSRKLKRLETERTLLAEQLADCQSQHSSLAEQLGDCQSKARVLQETFSDLPQDSRIGMLMIEQMVRKEVGIGLYDEQTLAPPAHNERIIDRLHTLVALMAHNHKVKEPRGCLS